MIINDVRTTVFKRLIRDIEVTPGFPDLVRNVGLQHYKKGAISERQIILVTIVGEGNAEGYCFVDGGIDQARFIESFFKSIIVGQDAFDREKLWQRMWHGRRSAHYEEKLLGAVDVALYDLAGKALGVPVSKLLGGYRDKVLAYASSQDGDAEPDGLSTPQAYADHAESCLKRGYKAYKIHPWGEPERDVAACKAVRERVGEDMVLMLDSFSAYDLEKALYVGREIENLDFYWYEEPMSEYNLYAYKKLADELKIPVLVTETTEGNLYSTTEYILKGAGDMMRSDVRIKGGITPVKKTATLCEAFGIKCQIHSTGNPLMNAACLHVIGSIMNCDYYEYGLLHPVIGTTSSFAIKGEIGVIDKNGYVEVPSKPGLGIEIDWDYIKENTIKG